MLDHIENLGTGKDLIVAPVCGLGNRTLSTIAALYYKHNSTNYRDVSLYWVRDSEFSMSFLDVYDADIKCEESDEEMVSYYHQDRLKKNHIYDMGKHYFIKVCDFFPKNARSDITAWAKEHTRNHLRFVSEPSIQLPKQTVGIHCRRSDYGININGKVATKEQIADNHVRLDIEFGNEIKKRYPYQQLFISTDSAHTLAYFKYMFKDRILYTTKTDYPTHSNRSEEAIKQAIDDFMILSSCEIIYRDSNSTFSYAAGMINNSKIETWERPVFKSCGATIIKGPTDEHCFSNR